MEGKLIIFSAPSGAGKTSLVRYLLGQDLKLNFSVSACTRPPREEEIHGKDYYFLSVNEFRQKIDSGEFVEWEEVYKDHYYGTLKSELQRIWDKKEHVIFDVDVIGGLNLKKQFKDRALSVFVSPPSLGDLRERLISRSSEDMEKIEIRVEKAAKEMEYARQFDRVLVNDSLEEAQKQAYLIVEEFLSAGNRV